METTEKITRLQEFLEPKLGLLLDAVRKEENFFVIDFDELSKFEPDIANDLLDNPEDTIKSAELAAMQFDLGKDVKRLRIRFKNLPKGQKIMIRNIRSKHIGKFMTVEGVVRQKSDVRPQVTSARFECPSCGNVINVLQLDGSFREPNKCGCGRKGKFRLLSKELVDAQGIVLEESSEDIEGGEQPKRINILLQDDLVSPFSERKTSPGNKIIVVGQIKEVPIIQRSGIKSTRFDLIIEANYVEPGAETFIDMEITEDEKSIIMELANDEHIYDKLTKSLAPSIYGFDKIKESLILQMMGGVRKVRKDGVVSRGDMHILLIGDPGSGKSAMLKIISQIAPKGRYVSGKGVSGAGLTASVVKDEFLKGWSLEAGALVLASNGVCAIDEMDKMSNEDRAAMHEALEQQTVSISKANIQATLIARTTVLAAANPKFGRFDPFGLIAEQIDLPPTLINRFDLIFPIKDIPEKSRDEKMADHMLNLHKHPESSEPEIPTNILKKYIAYSKQNVNPKLMDDAIEELKRYYLEMRSKGSGDESESRAVPISARQLEALVRIAEAYAKVRLSEKITKDDARKAVDMLHYSLSQVGIDPETGKIDIDRIATGISATQRSAIIQVKEIISELESRTGKNILMDDIITEGRNKGLSEDKIYETLEKLKRSGDVFEPKPGWINKI